VPQVNDRAEHLQQQRVRLYLIPAELLHQEDLNLPAADFLGNRDFRVQELQVAAAVNGVEERDKAIRFRLQVRRRVRRDNGGQPVLDLRELRILPEYSAALKEPEEAQAVRQGNRAHTVTDPAVQHDHNPGQADRLFRRSDTAVKALPDLRLQKAVHPRNHHQQDPGGVLQQAGVHLPTAAAALLQLKYVHDQHADCVVAGQRGFY